VDQEKELYTKMLVYKEEKALPTLLFFLDDKNTVTSPDAQLHFTPDCITEEAQKRNALMLLLS
jgi:hypothetical protein